MNFTRRKVLKFSSLSALLATLPAAMKTAFATWPSEAFGFTEYDESLTAVTGGSETQEGSIKIEAPEIASNGATVPITVSSDMENIKSISVLVDKNPRPYISTFFINEHLEASVSVRVKMRETSNVVAIVETDSGHFMAKQSVKVTAGGCA